MSKETNKIYSLLLLVFLLPATLSALPFAPDATGWITHPSVDPQAHAVVLFRKEFVLDEKPGTFKVHVSADNHYRLYVNGQYILRGPARGDLAHWFYETTDLAEYLHEGINLIAAEVVNWGPERAPSYFSKATAFFLQGDTPAEQSVDTKGEGWKCLHNTAHYPKTVDWRNDRSTIDFGFYAGNPTDSIRGDRYPWGWETPSYNDEDWMAAMRADEAAGTMMGPAIAAPYPASRQLVPRTIPLLRETSLPFGKVRGTIGLAEGNSYIDSMGSLVIPPNEFVIILIDQGQLTTGYPELIVSGGQNAILSAMYAENLIAESHSPRGNRDVIDGKFMVGIKDVFVPDGGRERIFRPTGLRTFRFIQLDIETFDQPLVIENYYHVASQMPLEMQAAFHAGDDLTGWMMEAGWNTVSLCAQDILFSDAYYEPLQHTGVARVHNLVLSALSGDDRLTRNALELFDRSRIPEGLVQASYPHVSRLVVPSHALTWVNQVYDYMLWRDDPSFIARFVPGIQNVLHWFHNKLQPDFLLENTGWNDAAAHPGTESREPVSYHDNNTTWMTLHYAYTLRNAAAIMFYLGNRSEARKYGYEAARISRAVNRLCKNSEGFYTEAPGSGQITLHTQAMAVLAEAATGQEGQRLLEQALTAPDRQETGDLFMKFYLFEALDKTGLHDHFLSELTEWELMKDLGLTTFTDIPPRGDERNQLADCRPGSSSPVYFFFRSVCGIRPVAAGHSEVEIAPSPGDLKTIECRYPHHLGTLEMNLVFEGSGSTGEITVPEGMKAVFVWNGKRTRLSAGTQQVSF